MFFSFFGIVDLLSVIPTYLSLILTGAQGLMVIRAIRLLRVFRIMKLNRYTNEGSMIIKALQASKVKNQRVLICHSDGYTYHWHTNVPC
jgi:voltage-gated potassium channel